MSNIDSTARIEKGAQIGRNVSIGPYCVIGGKVTIGDDCQLLSHVHIAGRTTIGARTKISAFASLGTPPQSVHYKGEDTGLEIGADCDLREHVTMNIGTGAGHGTTKVGDKCFLMVGAHVGHDCKVGNNVVFANNATLGGFAEIGDNVFLGGLCAVHQFTRVGEQAMVGGLVGVVTDVIPFALVIGHRGQLAGLNRVGLRRRGLSAEQLRSLYRGYQELFHGSGQFRERLDRVATEFSNDASVMRIVEFIRAGKRKLMQPRQGGGGGEDE